MVEISAEEYQRLQTRLRELESATAECRWAEDALRERTHKIGERVKELNCLYGISALIEKPGISLGEILQGTADLMRPTWQYPEITAVRVILEGQEFRTKNFTETIIWRQAADIMVHGQRIGAVEVSYLEERPESDEGLFLKEERNLLHAIAERLGRIVERMQAEEALRKAHDELEVRVAKRTAELAEANEELRNQITERMQAEEALQQRTERLRTLAMQLAEVAEAERQRLARELHDQVGQNLTALGINLNIVRTQLFEEAAAPARSRLDDSMLLVEQTAARIRDVMAYLRPPVLDDYGLVATLHWYGEQFARRTGIAVAVEGGEPVPRLAARVENALFRIAQEALTNAAKHAQATQVTVIVESDGGTLRLVVADDGIGFDASTMLGTSPAPLDDPDGGRGWGLLTMTERAEAVGGRCRIESDPRRGTRVIVEVER